MSKPKNLLIPIITSSLVVLAGCTHTQTTNTTNDTVNENTDGEVAVNTNTDTIETVNNENTTTADESGEGEIDTSDWQTYTNEEYGFSFRYPREWNLEEIQEGGLGTHTGDLIIKNDKCNIQITVPHEQFNLEQMASQFTSALSSKKYFEHEIELVNVNEVNAFRYKYAVNTYGEAGYIYEFMIDNNVFTYTLNYGTSDESCTLTSETIFTTLQQNS